MASVIAKPELSVKFLNANGGSPSAAASAAPIPVGYTTTAVDFDGVNDYGLRGSDLTGNADGFLGLISGWFRVDGGDGTQRTLFNSQGDTFQVYLDAFDNLIVRVRDTASNLVVNFQSDAGILAGPAWHHLIVGWDSNTGTDFLEGYIDDVLQGEGGSTSGVGNSLDYTRTNHYIATLDGVGGQKFDGCLADWYINFAEFLDPTNDSDRRKFIDASGKPVNLGTTGNAPTGTPPIIFLKGDSTNWLNNLGSGGPFALTGALTNCSSSPSD